MLERTFLSSRKIGKPFMDTTFYFHSIFTTYTLFTWILEKGKEVDKGTIVGHMGDERGRGRFGSLQWKKI